MTDLMHDKVALVTGAASGIGRAAALAFAREGAKLAVSDVDAVGGQETVTLVTQAGGTAQFIEADVSQAHAVETLIAQTVEAYGRLDAAFNNAGIEGSIARTVEYAEADWDRVIAVNLTGVWLCMKYEIPAMLEQGGGAIVNTSSAAGLLGFRGAAAYVASKHGVVGLTRTAALEYAKSGVRVNAVCPGAIDTPMMGRLTGHRTDRFEKMASFEPVGRMGSPAEIAEAVVWLCSDAASFVTGHAMSVDGGLVAQ